MFFYIKEWPDKTATLMAMSGAVLWTFYSVEEAQNVCRDWYQVYREDVDFRYDEIDEECISLDPACANCAMA